MKKIFKKSLSVALAVVLMASALPLIAGALAPSTGGSVQGASSSGQAPLKVEIRSNKDKYSLLGKMEFTATITNISSDTVEDISAQALLGASLRPLKNGSQFTATKESLAPGASFSFKYCADLNGLKGLDNLLLPLFWISSLFHGGKASIGNGNGGADYIEASKAVGVNSWFGGSYDASTRVRVWFGEPSDPGRPEVEMYDYQEEDISEDEESGMLYLNNIVSIYFTRESTSEERMAVVEAINGEIVGHRDMVAMLQVKVTSRTLDEIFDFCEYLEATFDIVRLATSNQLETMDFFNVSIDPWSGSRPNWDDANDPTGGLNWWLKFIKAPSAWLYKDYMNTLLPYNDNNYGPMKVGIIDSGFDTGHEDLYLNFINKENEKKNYHKEHGTHVAGIIGASHNDKGVTGVVPLASMWGYAVADNEADSEENTIWNKDEFYNGLWELVRYGCKIINVSGGSSKSLSHSNQSFRPKQIKEMGRKASEEMGWLLEEVLPKGQDFLVVQSAGNGAKDEIGIDSINNGYFCSITQQNCFFSSKVSREDIMNRIIIVTSTDKDYIMPVDANWGEQVSISAPGETIYSTLPNNQYGSRRGTSMATPIVSGVAHLVWSINPDFKADQVKSIVIHSADPNVRVQVNGNTPNAQSPNGDGYRLVNAQRAVITALGMSGIIIGEIDSPAMGYVWGSAEDFLDIITNVSVTVYKAGTTEIVATDISNEYGLFILWLDKGNYDLEFKRAGYTTKTIPLTISETRVYHLDDITLQDDGTGAHLFDGGTGAETDPYLLSSPDQLDRVRDDLTAHYKLINDIDLASWGNWEPIGTTGGNHFSGVFDGNGHIIKNMTINIAIEESTSAAFTETMAGLFGFVRDGVIKNTGIINSAVSMTTDRMYSSIYVGGVAGFVRSSTVNNCYNMGAVNAMARAGATAGAGGIVGGAYLSTISACYNTGDIIDATGTGPSDLGGIVGDVSFSTISNCYNTGKVKTLGIYSYISSFAGGIVGSHGSVYTSDIDTSAINNCYNLGEIVLDVPEWSNPRAGGLAGSVANSSSSIANCYYLNVIATTVGNNNGTLTNVFPLNAAQMKQQSSFVGFDFTTVWAINPAINDGYPYLRGMQP